MKSICFCHITAMSECTFYSALDSYPAQFKIMQYSHNLLILVHVSAKERVEETQVKLRSRSDNSRS